MFTLEEALGTAYMLGLSRAGSSFLTSLAEKGMEIAYTTNDLTEFIEIIC